jgi:hypothetical protein
VFFIRDAADHVYRRNYRCRYGWWHALDEIFSYGGVVFAIIDPIKVPFT